MTHGSVIDDFLTSTIILIPKGNNTNVTDSETYRGIVFSVSNGVKQEAIVSPILHCVYLDTLFIERKKAGVKWFIGN